MFDRLSHPERYATWRQAAGLWAGTRLPLLAVILLAGVLLPIRPGEPWYLSAAEPRNPFAVADALWYMDIARFGYGGAEGGVPNYAFFPLYPLIVRGLAWLGVPPFLGALIVANGAFLVALGCLFRLGEALVGADPARRASLYLAVFPFSFYFSHAYAESLFLALTLAAFLFGTRGRWTLCSLAALLAALTRPQGVLFVLPALVWSAAAVAQRRGATGAAQAHAAARAKPDSGSASRMSGPPCAAAGSDNGAGPSSWRPIVGPLVAGLAAVAGTAIFSAFCAWQTGDPLGWLHAHGQWGYELGFAPWSSYASFVGKLQRFGWYLSLVSEPGSIYGLIGALAALVFLGVVPLVYRRLGPAYALWTLAMLLIPMSSGSWEGLGRYAATVFPVFMVLGQRPTGLANSALAAGSAMLLGLLAALFVGGYPFT